MLQESGNETNGSVRQVMYADTYYNQSKSMLELIARSDIKIKHNQIDSVQTKLGPLGTDLVREGNIFTQDFSGGYITTQSDTPPVAHITKESVIRFVGFKAFGITDGPGSDEPYIITSVYSPDNKVKVQTTRIPEGEPFDDVDEGTVRVATKMVWSGAPLRMQVYTILMEHDNGDPEDVKKAVHDKLDEYADEAAAAGAAVAAGFGLPIPEGALRDVLGVITLGISSLAGNLFGDSKIGADSFPVYGTDLENIATNPFPTKLLDGVNKYTHETQLISGSGASYKVYYEIFTNTITSPGQ